MTRVAITFLFLLPTFALGQGTQAAYDRAAKLPALTRNKVIRDKIDPNWVEGDRFWYRLELPGGKKEFVLVDAAKGTREIVDEKDLPKGSVRSASPFTPKRPRGGSANS